MLDRITLAMVHHKVKSELAAHFPPTTEQQDRIKVHAKTLEDNGITADMHAGKSEMEMSFQEKLEWFAGSMLSVVKGENWAGLSRWTTMDVPEA